MFKCLCMHLINLGDTTGGHPRKHKEKMATNAYICIVVTSIEWRAFRKTPQKTQVHVNQLRRDASSLWQFGSFNRHSQNKTASSTERPCESWRMSSGQRYVWSDKCLIRGWWCGMVGSRLLPALLNKPSHTMISAVATYNLRQAAAPPTCADLSRSISLPL